MKIKLDHVSKYYDRKILDDLSLELEDVHALGIIGASGCGKSTLLRLLAGMERPQEGSIEVNGRRLQEGTVREYQNEIGYVFQKHNLFPHLTILENLVLILNKIKKVPGKEAKARAKQMLEQLHLKEEMNKRPDSISGGQAQRASIARALCTDPKLIFLDEPTAALDPVLTGEVLKAIRELKGSGKDFIFVTHELKFLRNFADHIIFLDKGKIVEEGPISCLWHPQTELLRNFVKEEDFYDDDNSGNL